MSEKPDETPAAAPAPAPAAQAPRVTYRRAPLYPEQTAAFFGNARWSLTEGTTKCFAAGTLVATARGHMPIEQIEAGERVLSWDGARYDYCCVLKRFDNAGVWKMIRLHTVFGEVVCTQDHMFRTPRGWVTAYDLAVGCFPTETFKPAVRPGEGDGQCLWPGHILSFECFEWTGVLHDLCVEETHNYCISRGNISVHNSGKTAGLIVWLSEQAILGKPDQNFWWIAPVAPVAAMAYRRMAKAIPYNLRTTHDTLQRITLVNGTHIWFKSGEKPDNLYGEDVYAAAIDEASRCRETCWFALRTTLSATQGKCRMIGNVKGRRNWFYRLCRKAESGAATASEYHKLTWRHAVAAGILDVAEVEDARSQLPPAVFQELFEAEASDDAGCPFGMAAIAAGVNPRGLSGDPAVCWGWDFARKHDYTVGVGLDRLGRVAAFHRFQMPWKQAIPLVREHTNRLPALVDSTGIGDVILGVLADGPGNFEGYIFTPRSKQNLMEALAIDIQTGKAQFPDGPIRSELETFEYEYTRTGVIYSAPEGMFDDCVCALALARWHHKAGHGAGTGAVGHGRLPAREAAAQERGYGNRELLIG